jgi:hypothetical protein
MAAAALPFVIVASSFAWHKNQDVRALTSFGLVRKRRNALRYCATLIPEARIGKGWSTRRVLDIRKSSPAMEGASPCTAIEMAPEWKS